MSIALLHNDQQKKMNLYKRKKNVEYLGWLLYPNNSQELEEYLHLVDDVSSLHSWITMKHLIWKQETKMNMGYLLELTSSIVTKSSRALLCLKRFSSASIFFRWFKYCRNKLSHLRLSESFATKTCRSESKKLAFQKETRTNLIESLLSLSKSFQSTISFVIYNDSHSLKISFQFYTAIQYTCYHWVN